MPKRLIVCSDGTWNTPDQTDAGTPCPTNVVKMARAISTDTAEGIPQVVFYDQGVGTGRGLDRWTGGAFGRGLEKNVEDAYRFLVTNFNEGDEIYFFGFSRGAYTVRSTAGMVRNCGILHKRHAHRIPEAYALYRRRDAHPDEEESRAFRSRYALEVRVHFIGVWDTVGALGIPIGWLRFLTRRKYEFHDVTLSSHVRHAAQALAIDERRKAFRPAVWETQPLADQRVEQAWFVGAHSNVGGGYRMTGLSDVAFQWMVEQASAAGLVFDEAYLRQHVHPDPLDALVNSRKGLYRLMRAHERKIGVGLDATQSIHPSVDVRRTQPSISYAPNNLLTAIHRGIPA